VISGTGGGEVLVHTGGVKFVGGGLGARGQKKVLGETEKKELWKACRNRGLNSGFVVSSWSGEGGEPY